MKTMLLFLLSLYTYLPAYATTFGPIQFSNQISQSQYLFHAIVIRGPWTQLERIKKRPYTYWTIRLLDDASPFRDRDEITLRQPGGEVNGLGYFIAGAAKFKIGEEIFVTAKDSNEGRIKEVVGLASGKYLTETVNGKEQVKSSLGFVVAYKGRNLSPAEFYHLAKKIKNGSASQDEMALTFNEDGAFQHAEESHSLPGIPNPPAKSATTQIFGDVPAAVKPDLNTTAINPQTSSENTEKPYRVYGIFIGVFLLAVIAWKLKKRK